MFEGDWKLFVELKEEYWLLFEEIKKEEWEGEIDEGLIISVVVGLSVTVEIFVLFNKLLLIFILFIL